MTDLPIAPDACTLPTAEQPLRLAEFDALFTDHVRSSVRLNPRHLQLRLTGDAGLEDRMRDLAARENECCSFFSFTVTAEGEAEGAIRFDIAVPEAYVDVLDALTVRVPR